MQLKHTVALLQVRQGAMQGVHELGFIKGLDPKYPDLHTQPVAPDCA
jgi:hypothetical protein